MNKTNPYKKLYSGNKRGVKYWFHKLRVKRSKSRTKLLFSSIKIKKSKNFVQFLIFNKKIILFSLFIGLLILWLVYYSIIISLSRKNLNIKKTEIKAKTCLLNSGQVWCASKQKCLQPSVEFCADDITKLVNKITASTKITFTDGGEHNFIWSSKSGDGIISDRSIQGEVYTASGLRLSEVQKIRNYLSSKAIPDKINVANGVAGGMRAYRYYNLVCTLGFRYKELKMDNNSHIVPVSDNLNVKLKCGFLNTPKSK